MKKLNVCILGASGYTGAELVRLLHSHPSVHITHLTAARHAGKPIAEVFPHLRNIVEFDLSASDTSLVPPNTDIVFAALPHGASGKLIKDIYQRDMKIIDLGADFRLKEGVYRDWYGDHSCPELLNDAVYGIPELFADRISKAKLVANPGCYPTCSVLPLAPLLKNNIAETEGIIIDSKSGASGAGRNPSIDFHFCQVSEGVKAYKVGGHRHTPEIEQTLSEFLKTSIRVVFTPHLIPMSRGMLSTIYVRLLGNYKTKDILDVIEGFYHNSPFIRVCPEGIFPNTSDVRGSNFCDIGVAVNPERKTAIVVCAIDNLVKGASGQAVQNMNIMFDLPQNLGLDFIPLHP